jgi:hypothetical protein
VKKSTLKLFGKCLFSVARQQHLVFGQWLAFIARLSDQINNERSIKSCQKSNGVHEERLTWQLTVFTVGHSEKRFLGNSEQTCGDGENKTEKSEENVDRHVQYPDVLFGEWKEIAEEAGDILTAEDDDSNESDPRMQRVEIRNGRLRVVVRVKSSDESDDGEEESEPVDGGVSDLQTLLAGISETAVDENRCMRGKPSFYLASKVNLNQTHRSRRGKPSRLTSKLDAN